LRKNCVCQEPIFGKYKNCFFWLKKTASFYKQVQKAKNGGKLLLPRKTLMKPNLPALPAHIMPSQA
jgi:hypothetical protein